jgi:hypothetical protein
MVHNEKDSIKMDDFGGTPISGNLHMGISLSFDVKQS